MMICPLQNEDMRDLLLDYSAGRLDAARAAMLARHMEQCQACSAFHMEQSTVWNALDDWEPMPVSLDFNRRLWQRIDSTANAPWYRGLIEWLSLGGWKPVFPVAVAILVIAGGFLLDHPGGPQASPASSVQGVSFSEADQLEQTLDDIQLLRQLDSVPPPSGSSKPM